jgi:hypothetical protein
LAVDAVTGYDQLRWSWKRQRDGTATASSLSHRKILQLLLKQGKVAECNAISNVPPGFLSPPPRPVNSP